ncbi:MAG: M3 family oligoendopeptidase [Phycisphaerae bacterium]
MTANAQTEFPRRYVAADVDLGRWESAETYYRELAERPLNSAADYERWLLDFSEVDAAFNEEGTSRYIAFTRQTDDPQREQRFLDFIENVKPKREPWHDRLRRKLDETARRFALPRKRYEVLERSVRNAIEIYRDENVPLQTEDEKLSQQYQKTCAAMTVQYDGREQTLQQLGRYLEEPDRAVREATWRLGADRFLQDAGALDTLYDQMVHLRDRIARNAGCRDFREYAFKAMERFDYTPAHCLAFHEAIETVVVPAARKLAEERRQKLKLDRLRPWDTAVDPENRPPLRPFDNDARLADGCSRIFNRVHPDLGGVFDTLRRNDSLDLGSRKGKAPGGYQSNYDERRMPFIFMNAVGTEGDVRTLLHEGGHAFHTWACRQEPLIAYRHYPTEFAEVASMGMECLALPHVGEFYGEDANRARRRFFIEIINFFPWMARVDGFQHYVYTHVEHSPEQRKDEWVKLTRRFSKDVDWSGLETYDRHLWHRKLHFFEVPFYYVEYGIAQLGALQVWLNSRRNYEDAVAWYRNGLALGGSRPLPELFEAAGCKFDFTAATLRPLIDAVMDEISRL